MSTDRATEFTHPWSWRMPALALLAFAVFFALYYFIANALANNGFFHPYLLFFGEKSLLALKGTPPRLENIGFIYPPLPVFLAIMFKADVLLAQGFTSAVISTCLFWEIIKRRKPFSTALLFAGFLVLSFPLLFLATQRFDLYLHLFLIILSLKFLHLYSKTNYSLNLFLSGPILGFTFFVHFNTIYLMPLFFVVLVILFRHDVRKLIAVTLVFMTPYFIFFMMFSYVNWIFTGSAFGFLANYKLMFSNPDVEAVVSSGNVSASLWYMSKYMLRVLPVIAPCLVAMYYDRKLVFVGPFFVIFSAVYSNLFYPSIYVCAVFLIYFFLLTDFGEKVRRGVMPALVALSVVSSVLLASFSADAHERAMSIALGGGAKDGISRYRAAVAVLSRTDGRILADDTGLYPVVYLMRAPDRFILPYRYEFVPALSNPAVMVNYVVAQKGNNRDMIFNKYEFGINGFHAFYDDGAITIWERSAGSWQRAEKRKSGTGESL